MVPNRINDRGLNLKTFSRQSLAFQFEWRYFRSMALSVEMVAEEALCLPISGRVLLVEKLLASLAGEATPVVERAHLDEVRRRRIAVRSGKAKLVDGVEGLRKARAAVRK
jgi:hypothetical protein